MVAIGALMRKRGHRCYGVLKTATIFVIWNQELHLTTDLYESYFTPYPGMQVLSS